MLEFGLFDLSDRSRYLEAGSGMLGSMSSLTYIPVLVGSAVIALVVAFQAPATTTAPVIDSFNESRLIELLLDIEPYEDLDYGFSVAIPTGWRKIISVESESDLDTLEPGYAVGFESPSQGGYDDFADYILIEILPGSESGSFVTDGSKRSAVFIDGKPAWVDQVDVDGSAAGLDDMDLTVYQAVITGLGYTVGIYAIGEADRKELMSAAFHVMVRTLSFTADPFDTA